MSTKKDLQYRTRKRAAGRKQLVLATPELLEAAQYFYGLLQNREAYTIFSNMLGDGKAEAVYLATSAAIRKATGEA
jgi:hypothetical protein